MSAPTRRPGRPPKPQGEQLRACGIYRDDDARRELLRLAVERSGKTAGAVIREAVRSAVDELLR